MLINEANTIASTYIRNQINRVIILLEIPIISLVIK